MVAIPQPGDPTLQAMKEACKVEGNAKERRDYLGASLIGNPCSRQIWYEYNGYNKSPFEAETLWNFEDGHRTEDLTAKRLRMVKGLELWTHDKDGKQFGFSTLGGKFRGSCDGVVRGLLQAPKTTHVWECKASAAKKFAEFQSAKAKHGEKGALKAWNEGYYIQAQLYMHFLGIDRHYLTVALAGGRDYESCRTEYNPVVANMAIDKAEKIINAKEPPPRIGGAREDFFICRWCAFKEECFK